ncbi:MAG: hypothetical protein ACRDOH_00100 [Streptosporangiaceae bacterium]
MLGAGLAAYPLFTAGRLAPLLGLLAAAGLLCVLLALLARGIFAAAALFTLAIEYTVAEATGCVPAGSVIGYAAGLIVVSELLQWSARLPRSAVADRAVAAGHLLTLAVLAVAAAVLAVAVLAAASLRLPEALEATLLGTAAAVALLALPWLLLRKARRRSVPRLPRATAAGHNASAGAEVPGDVHVAGYGTSVDDRQNGLVARVGAVHMRRAGDQGDAAAGDLLAGHEHDPLAARLALMSFPSHQPAGLTDGVLASARETLGHWRRQVAEWAELPSKPIPARIAETAQAPFGDLDTVSALALLRGLALDDGVPTGAKFETFLYADRILGLHLARDIGRLG